MASGLLISLRVTVIFPTTVRLVMHTSDPNRKGADGTNIDGDFSTFRGQHPLPYGIVGGNEPEDFYVAKASSGEFPARHGQGVSCAVLTYPSTSLSPPHYHSRASELLFVIQGTLLAGVISGANRLSMPTLEEGDMFVFQFNVGSVRDPGPWDHFGSRIANYFRTDAATTHKIKARLAGKL